MVRTFTVLAVACALAMATVPAQAAILTLPFVGDIEHPDKDPFHVMNPEAPAAAAPAPAPKKHRRMKKKLKKAM